MRFVAGLIVSMLVLVSCTDTEERFLGELLDQISEPPQDRTILLALVEADGSIDDASKGATPLGPNDPIRIASITKAFTATLVLTLVEDGLINLDASASGYVPRLSLPDEITVRSLLNHRSGLADYTQAAIYGNTEDATRCWAILHDPHVASEATNLLPGLADLSTLVDRLRATGLNIHLALDSPELEANDVIDSNVQLAAYRVVQEAQRRTLPPSWRSWESAIEFKP